MMLSEPKGKRGRGRSSRKWLDRVRESVLKTQWTDRSGRVELNRNDIICSVTFCDT